MGTGVAVNVTARLTVALIALSVIAGCGAQDNVDFKAPPLVATASAMVVATVAERRSKKSGATAAGKAKKQPSRAELEKGGEPVLRVRIPNRDSDAFLSVLDSRDGVVVWKTTSGTTFALRDGVMIQTRGLGPDLMSSVAPTVGQLLQDGGTHQRQYFFLGPNDQPTRRTYDCTVKIAGTEEVKIVGKTHRVTRAVEECSRPQSGNITNEFWIEGRTIRKSKQWASAQASFILFELVVD
jgi:Group 4 capsule polysaccharide lipoprotein gfcB, YjbF